MAEPIGEGFLGFSARSHLQANARTMARYLNPLTSYPIKKFSPVIINSSGRLEHAAVTGTNEVVTLAMTGDPEGGTFTLTFGGQETAAIPFDATAAEVQAALQALSTIGAGNVECTGGPFPDDDIVVEFVNALSGTNVGAITDDSTNLTGGTTPGVDETVSPGGALGVVSSTKLAGFSTEWEEGPLGDAYGRQFAQAPIELGLPFGGLVAGQDTPNREIIFYPAVAQNLFSGAIDATVAVTEALLASGGVACDIGYDPGNKRCYLRTASATNVLAKIVGIREDQYGVYGGVVDFKILDADSQFES